jgi:hypothetical protein
MTSFNRDINTLEEQAVKWWPDSLKKQTADISVIPLLLSSQENFIAILRLCNKHPLQIFELLEAAKFPVNLFLKHLTVLADYGGETTQRLNKNFKNVFGSEKTEAGKYFMDVIFQDKKFRYEFKALPIKGLLDNKKIGIDGKSMTKDLPLDPIKEDMIMLLLYGSTALNVQGADLEKCEISSFLGKDKELDQYVRQKYIWVSKITGGAKANTQGQLAQTVVSDYLREHLDKDYKVIRNGSIKLNDYEKPSGMPFDIVIQKNGCFIGVEVSFQVTTNSVIERKAGQVQDRHNLMHAMGYKIAYVIDGAGNFQRRSALSSICKFSDCTVAYSESEFGVLLEFIKQCL